MNTTTGSLPAGTRQDASLAGARCAGAAAGGGATAEPVPLEALQDAFAEEHTKVRQGSPATVMSYASDVRLYRQYLREIGAPDDVTSFRREYIQGYVPWLQGRYPSRETVRRHTYGVLALGRYAYRQGLIPEDPRRWIVLPRRHLSRRVTIPEWQDVGTFVRHALESAGGDFSRNCLAAAILLIALLGIRRTECLDLTWDDVLRDPQVHVVGKGDRDRFLPLAPPLRAQLVACRAVIARSGDASGSARVCQSALRRPLSPTTFNLAFRRAWEAAGCPGAATPHLLRHAVATTLQDRGATLAEVAAILGHSPLSFGVTGIYLHAAQRRIAYLLALLSSEVLPPAAGNALSTPDP